MKQKVCAVCGTPLHTPGGEINSSLYQDLGRANLLRMRGQSKEAIDLCLAILRKAPNNVTAHSLLGDIYYDQDDLRQAAEWYELASQLDPTADREKQLLIRIRQRLEANEHLATLQQIGVEQKAPPVTRYIVGGVVAIIAVGIIAFLAGNAAKSGPTASKPIVNPITLPATSKESIPTNASEIPENVSSTVYNDRELLDSIRSGQRKEFLISAVEIPNTNEIVLSVLNDDTYPASVNALFAASDLFMAKPNCVAATVRVIRNSRVYFSGHITRAAYDEAQGLSSQTDPNYESIAAQAFPAAFNASPTNVTVPPPTETNSANQTPSEGSTTTTNPKSDSAGE